MILIEAVMESIETKGVNPGRAGINSPMYDLQQTGNDQLFSVNF